MIGTPCYDGKVDVWYTNSLVNTIKMSKDYNIEITPLWVSFDALVQRARNDTISSAIEGNYDDLIWIDSDIEWNPEWVFKLLSYREDVVGGTYRKKGDREEYVVRQREVKNPDPQTGLIEVDGLGTGFVKMSKSALQYLWSISESYIDPKDNKERRLVCDVVIKDRYLMSEDIHMFEKLKAGGFQMWIDPKMCCNHIGPYKFVGNFEKYYKELSTPKKSPHNFVRPYRQL